MNKLIPLTELTTEQLHQTGLAYNPTGSTVFGSRGEHIGVVQTALVEEDTHRIQQLLIQLEGEATGKVIGLPIAQARIEHDGIYIDDLGLQQAATLQAQLPDQHVQNVQQGRTLVGTLELRREVPEVQVRREKVGEVTVRRERRVREETLTVQLVSEVLVIETRSGQGQVVLNGNVLHPGETTEVEIYREEAEVRKHLVKVEDVQVFKTTRTEQVQVPVEVAHEELVVEDRRSALSPLDTH